MHPFINIAIGAARDAGQIITQSLDRLDTVRVTEKSQNDFVSGVDMKAEKIIIEAIRKAYPNHGILAEESGEHPGDEVVWIVDPLDGTTNFLHGFPHFSISIAVQINNKIEHGVILDPVKQELFVASRGRGASLNDRRIRVSNRKDLQGALLGTGFPFKQKEDLATYLQTFEAVFQQAAGIRRAGSAALDLAYTAAGRLEGFWEFGLKPWDMAAGILMVKEAGGLVSDMHGGETFYETGNILAGSPKIFKSMLQIIKPLT